MSTIGKASILLLGLLLLWSGTLYFQRAPIERDLTEHVKATLNHPEFSDVSIAFSGRKGTLSGSVASAGFKKEAEKLAGQYWGVRIIDNQIDVAAENNAPLAAIETAVQASETAVLKGYQLAGKFLLSGTVPDAFIRTWLIQQAEKAFGDGNVTDHLSIRSGIRMAAGFNNDYGRFLDSHRLKVVGFEIENDTFTLKENLPGEFAKDRQDKDTLSAAVTNRGKSGFHGSARGAETDDGGELQQQKLDEFFKLAVVEFDTASLVLTEPSKKILDRTVEILSRFPENKIEIQGHTDNTGRPETNDQLSKARAHTVYEYLINSGIAAQRLLAKGYGDTQPLADNSTREGRRYNRRVVFQVK